MLPVYKVRVQGRKGQTIYVVPLRDGRIRFFSIYRLDGDIHIQIVEAQKATESERSMVLKALNKILSVLGVEA